MRAKRKLNILFIVLFAISCSKGDKDNIVGTVWEVSLDYDVPFMIMNSDPAFYELPRPVSWKENWVGEFSIDKRHDDVHYDWHSISAWHKVVSGGSPVQGWDNPDRDNWADCDGCNNTFNLSLPGLLNSVDYWAKPHPMSLTLDFQHGGGGSFLISFIMPINDYPGYSSCLVTCDHTVYYFDLVPPEPPAHYSVTEARGGAEMGWLFVLSAADQVVTTPFDEGFLTIKLKCKENCEKFNCENGCNDGNACTTDACVENQGCVYEPITGGSCQNTPCLTPGECVTGECLGGIPVSCDDENECTIDGCVPEFGCVNIEDDHFISNDSPNDCVLTGCFAGQRRDDIPADFEDPGQISPTDCLFQACSDGAVMETENPYEPGCQ